MTTPERLRARPLDPQAEHLLHRFRRAAAAEVGEHDLTRLIETARRKVRDAGALGPAIEPVRRVLDFSVPGPGGEIPVRLYGPDAGPSGDTLQPVFVFCHGGGFVAGDLDSHDALARALCNRAAVAVLSVAYRLAPEHPYPAANQDVWAALRWVVAQGETAGLDGSRVAVGGDSAGGLLAAWVAQIARDESLSLRLQVLLYPNLDATTASRSWAELGSGDYLVSLAQMRACYDCYLPSWADRSRPAVSPLHAGDLSGLAPALVVTADHDPLCDEGDHYAHRFSAAGVAVEHIRWPGMIHGFASLAGVLEAGQQVIDRAGAALRRALHEQRCDQGGELQ